MALLLLLCLLDRLLHGQTLVVLILRVALIHTPDAEFHAALFLSYSC